MKIPAAILLPAGLLLAGCDDQYLADGTPALTPYESACLAAVSAETGRSGVSLAGSDLSEAADTAVVNVNVPGAEAHWTCDSSAAGVVRSVSYSGSEGAL